MGRRDESTDESSETDSDEGSERPLSDEGSYVCGSCGEEIVVPLDASAGESQRYVEDCPVCCSPSEVFVDFDDEGTARVTSRPE